MSETTFESRRARRPLAVLAALAVFQLAGCGLGGPAYEPPAAGVAATVEMTNGLEFVPAEVHIKAGQTIEWRNRSLFTHTVTADPMKADDAADVALPRGADPFSTTVAPGEVSRRTFTVAGTYRYFCDPHEDFDMLGKIVVEPAP